MMTMPGSAMAAASGGAGKLGFSLDSISGLEALSTLSDLNGIIGMGGSIPSAKSGIDYIPRDDYLVKTHRGEAVLTADENAARRSGQYGGRQIVINAPLVRIDGNLIADEYTFNEFVEKIDYRLNKLAQWGH